MTHKPVQRRRRRPEASPALGTCAVRRRGLVLAILQSSGCATLRFAMEIGSATAARGGLVSDGESRAFAAGADAEQQRGPDGMHRERQERKAQQHGASDVQLGAGGDLLANPRRVAENQAFAALCEAGGPEGGALRARLREEVWVVGFAYFGAAGEEGRAVLDFAGEDDGVAGVWVEGETVCAGKIGGLGYMQGEGEGD